LPSLTLIRVVLFVAIFTVAFGAMGIVQAQEPTHRAAGGVAQSEAAETTPVSLAWKVAIVSEAGSFWLFRCARGDHRIFSIASIAFPLWRQCPSVSVQINPADAWP
jgi:hypothetical protein